MSQVNTPCEEGWTARALYCDLFDVNVSIANWDIITSTYDSCLTTWE